MKSGGRLAAAVEVLTDVSERHRPVATALSDWGKAHRFAGSGDRAVIGNLVYDALRRRSSLAARMGDDSPRSLILAVAADSFGLGSEAIDMFCDGSRHALAPLSDVERAGLALPVPLDAPDHVRADVPEWLVPSLSRALGDGLVAEGEAMARRAPLDLRVNRLKADRDKLLKALEHTGAVATRLSPVGVRIAARAGQTRLPNVEVEAAHGKGWFEVQDEGSQIAALLTGAGPRSQVIDLCAGAGGKTLAMGSEMSNTGQIHAYDRDKGQLRPIFERIRRAGLRNVQVMDAGKSDALGDLAGKMDVVLIDAPCSGSGTWRRRPDSKWRLKPESLEQRMEDQRQVLSQGAELVRPGGLIVYVTCSLLPEENDDQVADFLARRSGFRRRPVQEQWSAHLPGPVPRSADGSDTTLLLTPARHETDGFFIALIERNPA